MKREIEAFFSNTRAIVDTRRAYRAMQGAVQTMRVDGDQTKNCRDATARRIARRQAKACKLAMH